MATTVYTLIRTWDSSARYTASGDTEVLLSNPNDNITIHFTITTSDTTPAVDPVNAQTLLPKESRPMTLLDGERLWTSASRGYASLEV